MILNENDRYAAAWLRNLFPDATVDERSILDVNASDVAEHGRAHFFAGIGGWELALRLAGWPEDEEVWTGSCPCQPFSVAGKNGGLGDERHLWPAFHRLISERRPATVFGEQVASRAGREWLAGVRVDLENLGYAVGAADLCAASVGAPHIRQRLFWVAQSEGKQRYRGRDTGKGRREPPDGGDARWMGDSEGTGLPERRGAGGEQTRLTGPERDGRVGNADHQGPQGRRVGSYEYADLMSAWSTGRPLLCLDGKTRRVEPGIFPLAHGIPGRVGRLRAYGNAVVPPLCATFIKAFLDAKSL